MVPQPGQEIPEDLMRLADILVGLGEDNFRTFYEERYGGSFAQLPEGTLLAKAMGWLLGLYKAKRIPWLVQAGKDRFPNLPWDPSENPPLKYCVVSSLPEMEVDQKYVKVIEGYLSSNVERVWDGEKADCLIFDLDHAPANWIRYLLDHIRKVNSGFDSVLFVTPDSEPNIYEPDLKGNDILSIIARFYGKANYDFKYCLKEDDLKRFLFTMIQSNKNKLADKSINTMTISTMRNNPNSS